VITKIFRKHLSYNHRRYKAGKRKGKTPVEVFTGETMKKGWIELLSDVVKEKDPFKSVNYF